MSCCYVSYLCLLLCGFLSLPGDVLSLGRSRTIAKHSGFRESLWVASSCWEEVALFHCKSCAFHWVEAALLPNTLVSEVLFCGLHHHVGKRWLSFIERAVLSLGRSHTIAKHTGFRGFLWVDSSCWEEVTSLSLQGGVLSVGWSRAIAKHTGFRCFLWVGSSCWEEMTLFHCKRCAFSRSKPRYCQTHWFQRFFVGWLIMLGRGGSLSLQELCFQYVEAALLPNTTGFRSFLWVGSSCWEEVTLFHSLIGIWWFNINFPIFPHRNLMVYHWFSNPLLVFESFPIRNLMVFAWFPHLPS